MRHFLGVKRTPSTEHRIKREERRKLFKSLKRSKRLSNEIIVKDEKTSRSKLEPLPEYKEFDARNEWPECADVIDIIQVKRDQ